MLLAQSCIVADPPEYKTPGRTRPVLNAFKAVPETTKVLVVYTGKVATSFSVPVRSEDAGEDLRALFYLDYEVQPGDMNRGESPLNSQKITASTYANTSREATYPWLPTKQSVSAGCHFVTLIVAHRSSFQSSDENHLDASKAVEDAALLTWTVNVDPPSDGVNTLLNCPSSTSPVQ